MSENREARTELAVGLTVLASIVVLIGGIIWGKGISFRSDHKSYLVQFKQVYGLKEGSAVLVKGVTHGKVGNIALTDDGALVTVDIDRSVPIFTDATVLLFAPQLMGGRLVSIDPGKGPQKLEEGGRLRGTVPAGMGEVMASSGEVLNEMLLAVRQLRTTAMRVDSMFVKSNMVGRVEGSLANIEAMSSEMRKSLSNAAETLNQSAVEVRQSTEQVNMLLTDNRPRVDTLVTRLNQVVSDAENFTVNLKSFSNAMNDETGSLGKLVYNDSLHVQLIKTMNDLDALIIYLKEEGINVSLF